MDPSPQQNPWETLSAQERYEDEYIRVVENKVRNAAGRVSQYGVVCWKKRGVTILPVDDQGCTYLVGQFRYAANRYSWELPRGGVEKSEDLMASAQRELREEVGLEAQDWLELTKFMVSGSLTDEHAACFAAWALSPAERKPDDSEVLQIRRLPFKDAVSKVLDGTIFDAVTAALVLGLHVQLERGGLPASLRDRLR